MEIPEQFQKLDPFEPGELLDELKRGEPVRKRAIGGDALKTLHNAILKEAIPDGISVRLEGCRIDGDLNFTNIEPQAFGDLKGLSSDLWEKLERGGIEKAVLVKRPLEISKSYINGNVLCSFDDDSTSVVLSKIDFFGTEFRYQTSFYNATFCGFASFGGTIFCDETSFVGARFWDGVSFEGAAFGKAAFFVRARFGDGGSFGGADFGDGVFFGEATFGKGANFVRAILGKKAFFDGATFGKGADFFKAIFGEFGVSFRGADFGEGASFGGADFGEGASFRGAIFGDGASFGGADFGKEADLWGTTFKGSAWFLGRRRTKELRRLPVFRGEVDFRSMRLEVPEKVQFQQVDLSKASFLNTRLDKVQFIDVDWNRKIRPGKNALFEEKTVKTKEEYELVAQLYRQLKKNYEEQRDYPGAGDFHYGEMEMTLRQYRQAVRKWLDYEKVEVTPEEFRDGRRKLFDLFLLGFYKILSGYGEKPGRALAWAAGVLLVPAVCYWLGEVTFDPASNVLRSFIDYVVRSLGFMTFRILQTPNEIWAKLLMAGQALLGPIQLALTALALRRKFRR